MISRRRMTFDLLGQFVIITAILLLVFFASGIRWTNIVLVFLAIWQFCSAAHLFYVYKYIKKQNYLRTTIVLAVSLPIWIKILGLWAYLPVVGVVLWYFIQTIRDTISVYNRPKSFWELF